MLPIGNEIGWKKPDLFIGEDVTLPPEMFETGETVYKEHRILYQRYVGCTDHFLTFEVQYRPAFASEDPLRSVLKTVMFSAIYTGDIKIKRGDGETLRVYRKIEGE